MAIKPNDISVLVNVPSPFAGLLSHLEKDHVEDEESAKEQEGKYDPSVISLWEAFLGCYVRESQHKGDWLREQIGKNYQPAEMVKAKILEKAKGNGVYRISESMAKILAEKYPKRK
ncbi:MAG TPA: hypothetical protein VKE88_03835 [Candidatus Nanoarchaeia archaeon]|nr:hypothetical protein [Candidatus Nanoarchaeia archaeon]